MANKDFVVKNGLVTGTNTATFGTAVYNVSNGNVGIGTSTPGDKLSVAGTVSHGNTNVTGYVNASTGFYGTVATATQGTINHDSLANFVSNEHIDHTTVSIATANGLSGGGTIASTRNLYVSVGNNQLVANTTGLWVDQSKLDHDSLANFVADEHIAHSTVSIATANGLSGGGTIASTRTLTVTAGTGVVVNTTGVCVNSAYIGTLAVASATNAGSAASITGGIADNGSSNINLRVIRNINSSTNNDGMYIGYGNSNSGRTRVYSAGSSTGHYYSDASGNLYKSDDTAYCYNGATWSISINGSAGYTGSSVTFNNGGAGDASGTTFNGGSAKTISYNSIGAPSTTGTNASGTWSINVNGSAGSATNASYATSAGSATNASYATSAGSATNASYATNAGISGFAGSRLAAAVSTSASSSTLSGVTASTRTIIIDYYDLAFASSTHPRIDFQNSSNQSATYVCVADAYAQSPDSNFYTNYVHLLGVNYNNSYGMYGQIILNLMSDGGLTSGYRTYVYQGWGYVLDAAQFDRNAVTHTFGHVTISNYITQAILAGATTYNFSRGYWSLTYL